MSSHAVEQMSFFKVYPEPDLFVITLESPGHDGKIRRVVVRVEKKRPTLRLKP